MSKNISNLSGRIGLKDNLFKQISENKLSESPKDIKEIAKKHNPAFLSSEKLGEVRLEGNLAIYSHFFLSSVVFNLSAKAFRSSALITCLSLLFPALSVLLYQLSQCLNETESSRPFAELAFLSKKYYNKKTLTIF